MSSDGLLGAGDDAVFVQVAGKVAQDEVGDLAIAPFAAQ